MNRYGKIYDLFANGIENGVYPPGTKLPSIRELAADYGVSIETVRQALRRLKKDRKIVSEQGVGVFVAEEQDLIQNIMLIGPLEGHFYYNLFQEFTTLVNQHPKYNLIAENVNIPEIPPDYQARDQRILPIRRKIEEMRRRKNLAAIFFNGSSRYALDFLACYIGKIPLFCFCGEEQFFSVHTPAVSIDFFHGGYIGIRHLYDAGCRNVIVDLFKEGPFPSPRGNLFLNGCEMAAGELGVKLHYCRFSELLPEKEKCEAINAIFASDSGIDGIFSFGDSRLIAYRSVFEKWHRIPGQDIALLGFFDTPWCQMFSPPLSSVHVFPDRIAKTVFENFLSAERSGEYLIRIPPEIRARESSRLSKKP